MSDPLFLEVPPPLSKFDGQPIIDDSNNTLLEDAQDARLLTKEEIKRLKAKAKELKALLEHNKYEAILERLEDIKRTDAQYKIELHNLKIEYDACQDSERIRQIKSRVGIIREYRKALRIEYNQINQQNQQNRSAYRRYKQIQTRLDEHKAAVHYQKQYSELCNEMAKEAAYFADKLQLAYTQMGYCNRVTINTGRRPKTKVIMVKFAKIIVCPDEIQYKIKVQSRNAWNATINHLPTGVNAQDLIKPETIYQLSVALERPVYSPINEGDADYHQGLWVCIRRNGIAGGIIQYITYRQIMTKYNSANRDLLPLPLGVRTGRLVNWLNLAETPHMMVTGKSGAGKSNVINVIISTLISKHSPEEIRLILIDLKEGVELERYRQAPHIIGKVITEVEDVYKIMRGLETLRARRMKEIKKVASSIDEYNYVMPEEKRMERILVVFDEYAAIGLRPDLEDKIKALTDQIAAKSRAAGIHLLIGTQASFSDVSTKLTRVNISVQIAGAQQTLGGSMATVGSADARKLDNIPGRMLIQVNGENHTVQMPHIKSEDIQDCIRESMQYETPVIGAFDFVIDGVIDSDQGAEEHSEPLETLIIDCALEHFDGELKARRIWEDHLKDKFSFPAINSIVSEIRESENVSHRGTHYHVTKIRNYCRLELIESKIQATNDTYILDSELEADLEPEKETA